MEVLTSAEAYQIVADGFSKLVRKMSVSLGGVGNSMALLRWISSVGENVVFFKKLNLSCITNSAPKF